MSLPKKKKQKITSNNNNNNNINNVCSNNVSSLGSKKLRNELKQFKKKDDYICMNHDFSPILKKATININYLPCPYFCKERLDFHYNKKFFFLNRFPLTYFIKVPALPGVFMKEAHIGYLKIQSDSFNDTIMIQKFQSDSFKRKTQLGTDKNSIMLPLFGNMNHKNGLPSIYYNYNNIIIIEFICLSYINPDKLDKKSVEYLKRKKIATKWMKCPLLYGICTNKNKIFNTVALHLTQGLKQNLNQIMIGIYSINDDNIPKITINDIEINGIGFKSNLNAKYGILKQCNNGDVDGIIVDENKNISMKYIQQSEFNVQDFSSFGSNINNVPSVSSFGSNINNVPSVSSFGSNINNNNDYIFNNNNNFIFKNNNNVANVISLFSNINSNNKYNFNDNNNYNINNINNNNNYNIYNINNNNNNNDDIDDEDIDIHNNNNDHYKRAKIKFAEQSKKKDKKYEELKQKYEELKQKYEELNKN